jgi:hypothetical protein
VCELYVEIDLNSSRSTNKDNDSEDGPIAQCVPLWHSLAFDLQWSILRISAVVLFLVIAPSRSRLGCASALQYGAVALVRDALAMTYVMREQETERME